MSAQQNKQNARDAYAAFGSRDAEAAMRDLDDSIAWTEGGTVVVLTTRELGGERTEGADVLTFNDAGKLISFEALGDTKPHDRRAATAPQPETAR
jgi:hypothetical protein